MSVADQSTIFHIEQGISIIAAADIKDARLFLYFPRISRWQLPIGFRVSSTDEVMVTGIGIHREAPTPYVHLLYPCPRGMPGNRLLVIHLGDLPRRTYGRIKVELSVLCWDRPVHDPDCPVEVDEVVTLPREVYQWLQPTRVAQANAPAIVEFAREKLSGVKRIEDLAHYLVAALSRIQRDFPRHGRLDALACLQDGGTCTGFANLAAALARAAGIPCRQKLCLIPMPTPYEVHWVVEIYCPRHGWFNLEPIQGLYPFASSECIDLWLLEPREEDIPEEANGIAGYYWEGTSHPELVLSTLRPGLYHYLVFLLRWALQVTGWSFHSERPPTAARSH